MVSSDWTFRSASVPGAEPTPVPLLAVRFAPRLDDANRAPAGRPFLVPVYVQRNGSATPGRLHTPAIQVSYDDGTSWRPVTVIRTGSQWLALVSHPAGAKFVSLKANVNDGEGNTVDQTIIRAYALK